MQKQREKIILVSYLTSLCFQNDSEEPIIWGRLFLKSNFDAEQVN